MKQVLLTGAALLMSVSSAAFAATPPDTHAPAAMGATPAPISRPPMSAASDMPAAATRTAPPSAASDMPAAATKMSPTAAMDSAMFANVSAGESLASKVVGLTVYNNTNQNLGKIKDIAFDSSGVKAYIVSVGGFLGMGDHYVAVSPSAININYDSTAKQWHAAMNTNADQLKSAPEYKYSSNE